jgi:hypothetical protein
MRPRRVSLITASHGTGSADIERGTSIRRGPAHGHGRRLCGTISLYAVVPEHPIRQTGREFIPPFTKGTDSRKTFAVIAVSDGSLLHPGEIYRTYHMRNRTLLTTRRTLGTVDPDRKRWEWSPTTRRFGGAREDCRFALSPLHAGRSQKNLIAWWPGDARPQQGQLVVYTLPSSFSCTAPRRWWR